MEVGCELIRLVHLSKIEEKGEKVYIRKEYCPENKMTEFWTTGQKKGRKEQPKKRTGKIVERILKKNTEEGKKEEEDEGQGLTAVSRWETIEGDRERRKEKEGKRGVRVAGIII